MSYARSQETKKRLEKLHEETKRRLDKMYQENNSRHGSGALYDNDKKRYVKISLSYRSDYPKFLRRQTNKRVRKCGFNPDRGQYRKLFDYWCELF